MSEGAYFDEEVHDEITGPTEGFSAMEHWARKPVGLALALAEVQLCHHERPASPGLLLLFQTHLFFKFPTLSPE